MHVCECMRVRVCACMCVCVLLCMFLAFILSNWQWNK